MAKEPYQWGVGAIVCVSRSQNFFLWNLTTLQAISNIQPHYWEITP